MQKDQKSKVSLDYTFEFEVKDCLDFIRKILSKTMEAKERERERRREGEIGGSPPHKWLWWEWLPNCLLYKYYAADA